MNGSILMSPTQKGNRKRTTDPFTLSSICTISLPRNSHHTKSCWGQKSGTQATFGVEAWEGSERLPAREATEEELSRTVSNHPFPYWLYGCVYDATEIHDCRTTWGTLDLDHQVNRLMTFTSWTVNAALQWLLCTVFFFKDPFTGHTWLVWI